MTLLNSFKRSEIVCEMKSYPWGISFPSLRTENLSWGGSFSHRKCEKNKQGPATMLAGGGASSTLIITPSTVHYCRDIWGVRGGGYSVGRGKMSERFVWLLTPFSPGEETPGDWHLSSRTPAIKATLLCLNEKRCVIMLCTSICDILCRVYLPYCGDDISF